MKEGARNPEVKPEPMKEGARNPEVKPEPMKEGARKGRFMFPQKPPHTPKAVTYHEQSRYCRFMIGHSLGRMGTKAMCLFMIGHSLGRMGVSCFRRLRHQ